VSQARRRAGAQHRGDGDLSPQQAFAYANFGQGAATAWALLLLSEMMSSLTGVDWGVLFAAVTIRLVPVVAFVWTVQRWLVAGLSAGAVTGPRSTRQRSCQLDSRRACPD
jgi:hypothetical protein